MHMEISGAIGHFYHLQLDLTHTGTGSRSYISKWFHQYVVHWKQLLQDVLTFPTFLSYVVQRLPTEMGFYDTSGLGAGDVCI